MHLTIKQLAKKLNISWTAADALTKMLLKKGIVRKIDAIKPQRGRPSTVYDYPQSFTLDL